MERIARRLSCPQSGGGPRASALGERLQQPVALDAQLDAPNHVYDLRGEKYLGLTSRISFTLDPWQPTLFALLPEKLAADKVIDYLLDEPSSKGEKK